MVLHIIGSGVAVCTQRVNCVLAEKGITDFTTYEPDMMGTREHKVAFQMPLKNVSLTMLDIETAIH